MKKLVLATIIMGISSVAMAGDAISNSYNGDISENIQTVKFCSFELNESSNGNDAETFDKKWTVINDGQKAIDNVTASNVALDGAEIDDVFVFGLPNNLSVDAESNEFGFSGTPIDGLYTSTISISCVEQ